MCRINSSSDIPALSLPPPEENESEGDIGRLSSPGCSWVGLERSMSDAVAAALKEVDIKASW